MPATLAAQAAGYLAATLVCASSAPQIIKTLRTRSARDISWGYLALFIGGEVAWLLYGILTLAPPLIIANAILTVGFSTLALAKARLDRAATTRANPNQRTPKGPRAV